MSLNRYDARRDANERGIIEIVEKCGARVEQLKWPCDLAISFRERHFLIEVHNPESKYRKRDAKQLEMFERLRIPIVTTADEVLRIIGVL